jgi:hypothetical protein
MGLALGITLTGLMCFGVWNRSSIVRWVVVCFGTLIACLLTSTWWQGQWPEDPIEIGRGMHILLSGAIAAVGQIFPQSVRRFYTSGGWRW